MTLLIDTFSEHEQQLRAEGWVFTSVSRYDPTVLVGLTPTGKTFSLTLADNTATITVAGKTKTLTRAKDQWEQGDLAAQTIRDVYALLPASQR